MRFEKLKIRNVGVFRGEREFDFAAMPGPLVAVCGPNGSGKSTTLELLLGALTRKCPTRGSLVSLATARDSLVEVTVVNGARYVVRQLVDRVSGKGETAVIDESGRSVVESAKVRAADEWIASHFPPPEVLLNSVFSAQGSAGFLGLSPAERKGLLLKVLGVERYEAHAATARERASAAKSELQVAESRISDARSQAADPTFAAVEVDLAREAAQEADAALARARDVLASIEEETRAAAEQQARHLQSRQVRGDLQATIAGLEAKIVDRDERRRNNLERLIGRRDAILAADRRLPALRAEIEAARASESDLRALVGAAEQEARAASDAYAAADRRRHSANTRSEQAATRLKNRSEVELAVAMVPEAETELGAAATAWKAAEAEVERVRAERLAGAEDRIKGLRGCMSEVADMAHGLEAGEGSAEDIELFARGTLATDDDAVKAAADHPARVHAAERAARDAYRAHETARERLGILRQRAAAAPHLAQAEADRAAADQEAAEAFAEMQRLGADRDVAQDRRKQHSDALSLAKSTLSKLHAELGAVEANAALVTALAEADAKVAGYDRELGEFRGELAAAQERLAATPEVPFAGYPDTTILKERVTLAEGEARRAHAAIALREQELERAQAAADRIATLEAARVTAELELADWNRLSADLGKEGLQAMIIDSAIPEIAALCNDLLVNCHGTRFAIDIRTQAADAKGRRLLETLDVIVIDTVNGREGPAETFSGGERTILAEALALALTVVGCRQLGMVRPFIIRDESGAALDPSNARVYVQMLRRAAEQIQAEKVLFVSHSPACAELADSQLDVSLGGAP